MVQQPSVVQYMVVDSLLMYALGIVHVGWDTDNQLCCHAKDVALSSMIKAKCKQTFKKVLGGNFKTEI